jgi:two-component system, NtrC family, response regulator
VALAADRGDTLAQLRRHEPAVVTLDLGLPPAPDDPSEGLRTLQEILTLAPQTKVIVLTGQSDRANALKAVALGAYDFYAKPFEPEVLTLIIERAFRLHELQEENRRLQMAQGTGGISGFITRDPVAQRVCRTVEKISPSNVTVMVLGESGTGKEIVARALHDLSPRAARRFVAINCAAIPDALLESELFGHEKGAFTGAVKQTIGRIETAHRGTLFLDEIGDLPLPLQAKLLRFLQERSIERIGGRDEIPVDVRVVCATHRDLKALIAEGRFREDLYYRLAEIVLVIPPLRERAGDASLIAHAFAIRYATELKRGTMHLQPDALVAIDRYSWPGNVRELENVIKRAVVMADGHGITAADLDLPAPPAGAAGVDAEPLNLRAVREAAEQRALLRALARTNNNLSRAAELLGISRPTLYDLMERVGLKPPGVSAAEGK